MPPIQPETIEQVIYLIRGQKLMLDSDLARLYGVATKVLNQSVRRNINRFPSDFMVQLSREDLDGISQSAASSNLKSHTVTLKRRGGRRYLPYAFTEQGVAMLSTVLNSERAIYVNIEIMRAFVRLRQLLSSNVELAQKLAMLEKKYDKQFKVVFNAIRQLMEESARPHEASREIGFHTIKESTPKNRTARKSLS